MIMEIVMAILIMMAITMMVTVITIAMDMIVMDMITSYCNCLTMPQNRTLTYCTV